MRRLSPTRALVLLLAAAGGVVHADARPTRRVVATGVTTPPPHHVGNLKQSIVLGQEILVPKSHVQEGILIELRRHELSLVTRVTDDGFVEVRAPSGEARRFEIKPERTVHPALLFTPFALGAMASAGRTTLREVPTKASPPATDPLNAPKRIDTTVLPRMVDKLADGLARSQIRTSTSARLSGFAPRITNNLIATNRQMLAHLISGKPLTVHDLEDWNLRVQEGLLDREKQPKAGVLRGTRKLVDLGGERVDVDLRDQQVGDTALDGTQALSFLPAGEVPRALSALVERVNRLDRSSTFLEVARVYRDFVHIHPFADGNGRAGRVLLDYALLKAGFPPLPHGKSTGLVMYRDAGEVARSLADAYGNAGS
jgi:hypothetical protein